MKAHIQTGVSISVFGSKFHLAFLGVLLFLPVPLQCANVLCFYCKLTPTVGKCQPVLSLCSPGMVCAKGNGKYGNGFFYFNKGCLWEKDCHVTQYITFLYHNVSMTNSCCDWNYCNAGWCPTASWHLLGLMVGVVALLSNWWL